MRGLRYRLVSFLVQFALAYLRAESEWEPRLDIVHLDEEVQITFKWPELANMPTLEVLVREKP